MSDRKRPRGKYEATSWKAYNAAFKARGALTVGLDKDTQRYANATGKRGRQQVFADTAIQFCLKHQVTVLPSLAPKSSLVKMNCFK